jgi:tetratricopeptide (TPR) repeat protein
VRPGRLPWGRVLAALICLAAAAGLQTARDARWPLRARAVARTLYVPTGPALRRAALSFDALAADIYWIRAIQHYGGDRLGPPREGRYELLLPLLQATTTLDPRFMLAYRFGAIFLSEPPPGGPGQPAEAIALLEKGIAATPDKWQYFHDIAFVHYWVLHDSREAARWFQLAADRPGAPNWLRPLAAAMVAERDRGAARLLWQQLLQSDQPWMQRTAERSLLQLDALDRLDELQAVVAGSALGPPLSWPALVRAGRLPGVPLDPVGVPYDIDPATGHVAVSPDSSLSPMPDLSALRR